MPNHRKYYTREELRQAIVEATGIPIGRSTMEKECAPAINKGPPISAWSGKRPLYTLEDGIAWAESRLRLVRPEPPEPRHAGAVPPRSPEPAEPPRPATRHPREREGTTA